MTETLSAAIGRYPHTEKLRDGRAASPLLTLAFDDVAPINRAFAPMVRAHRFDVCEMAIATYLQARACGKPLILLPVVLAARYQEPALVCRAAGPVRPEELAGKRIGVRAYSQTTGMWLRGVLQECYGIAPDQMRWVTFEDAHVAEMADPPFAERAPPGRDLLGMLRSGEIDAAIVGNDLPSDTTLRPVFGDIEAAARVFHARYGVVPINHMVVVTRALAERAPELVAELMCLFRRAAEGMPTLPIGVSACASGVALALRFAQAQHMLSRTLRDADVWEGLPTLGDWQ